MQIAAGFSGIVAIKDVIWPRCLGIRPDAIVLECVPQATAIPTIGTLEITDSIRVVYQSDMKVDFVTARATPRGIMMMVRLLDRRWRWKYSPIKGRYNVVLPDGTIDPSTQRSTQELAALCFQAMNESVFDVSVLPVDDYPFVDWNYDRADIALFELCSERGCDIRLSIGGYASVVRLGHGNPLVLTTDSISPVIGIDSPEGPDFLLGVTGEIQYQSRLKIVPVALETDGTIVAADDVSYAPASGWSLSPEMSFKEQLREEGFGDNEISLARRSVGRWFQISSMSDGSMDVPGYGTIGDIAQILPINDYILQSSLMNGSSRYERGDCRVIGKSVTSSDPPSDKNPEDPVYIEVPFIIDRHRGIVKFQSPMLKKNDDNDGYEFAELYLETSYGVKDASTGQSVVYEYLYPVTGAANGLVEAVVRPEISPAVVASYQSDEITIDSYNTNQSTIDSEWDGILSGIASGYTFGFAGSCLYRGVQLVELDGVTRQVVYYISDRTGAQTLVSSNSEAAAGPPRSIDRRRMILSDAVSQLKPSRVAMSRLRDGGYAR